jgi:hypothetical protein
MKTIKVEKIFTKEIPADPDGKYKAFTAYSVLYKDSWYNLRGKANELKEGDEITGEIIETKPYTNKDGDKKVAYTFKLLGPEMTEIFKRLEKIEKVVFPDGDNGKKDAEEINVDDIPF